jgi:hypothetical protein
MAHRNRFAAASALAAAFSLAATPAMARDYHHHHWHRWHRDRIDGGDVLAGALILGGIAAIASAASKQDREERRAPAAPPPVPDDRQEYGYDGPERDQGLDRAAGMCIDAVERGRERVDTVDNVARDRDGWAVSGALESGAGFTCRIGNDGRVRNVDVGGPRAEGEDGQYDDSYYARAREAQTADDRPEWHGDAAPPEPRDDGRYAASQAPDFGQGV